MQTLYLHYCTYSLPILDAKKARSHPSIDPIDQARHQPQHNASPHTLPRCDLSISHLQVTPSLLDPYAV